MGMTLKRRAMIFYAVALLSLVIIIASLGERWGLFLLVGALWGVLAWMVGAPLLKCPHCQVSAVFPRKGAINPLIGDRCKSCGKAY